MDKKGLPQIRLICGTGRCGTWTWFRIMQAQGAEAWHEGIPLPWEVDACTFYYYMLQRMIDWGGSPIWSNSSFVWINYMNLLFKNFIDPRVVCIQRDRDLLIESFMAHWPYENYWTAPESDHWDNQWPKAHTHNPDPDAISKLWPKYDLPKEDAIAKYYDDYYQMARYWHSRLPANFLLMDMEAAMNTEAGQRRIFDHFGIQNPQVYVGVRLNDRDKARGMIYLENKNVHGADRVYEIPQNFRPKTELSLQPGPRALCRDLSEDLWRADPSVSDRDREPDISPAS